MSEMYNFNGYSSCDTYLHFLRPDADLCVYNSGLLYACSATCSCSQTPRYNNKQDRSGLSRAQLIQG